MLNIDKMLFPGAGKMLADDGLMAVQREFRRRTGKSFMASFGVSQINDMLSSAGLRSKQATYVDVTSEDLMRRKVTREVEADDPIIEGLVQEIERQDATIADLLKRVEALEKPAATTTEDTERQRKARNAGTLESLFGMPFQPAPAQVQRQTTRAPSPVFGDLFTGSPAPAAPAAPIKKDRSMFDPLYRDMDVPVQRQTQQAQPNTVESLTRRKG